MNNPVFPTRRPMDKGIDRWHDPLYLAKYADSVRSSWAWYKRLVDNGRASTVCPVGTQIVDKWARDANTVYAAPWDIVHYDSSGNAFVKFHYATPDTVPVDEPEALYYFDGTEQAGVEYYILIKTAYGTGWVANTGIAFMLITAPAEGDQLVLATGTDSAKDPTNMTWRVYGAGSTTVKQSGTTTNSTAGTKLGETSASGVGYTNGRVNAPQRVVYGYNRWSQCAQRQYLNSDASAGAWWSMQNPWDRPPSVASTLRGFMAGLTDDMRSVLSLTDVVTAINTAEGSSETFETTQDYIFLPALEQMYISPQISGEGGSWDYYKALAAEAGLTGMFQLSQTYSILRSYNLANTGSPVNVRLRAANRTYSCTTWYINSGGYVSYSYANYSYRACPACKIKKL